MCPSATSDTAWKCGSASVTICRRRTSRGSRAWGRGLDSSLHGDRADKDESRPRPQAREPRDVLRRQIVTDALPHFQAVSLVALGHIEVSNEPQRPRNLAIRGRARLALLQVPFDPIPVRRLAVVVERQIVVGVMGHTWFPVAGRWWLVLNSSSSTRNFF